MSKKFKVLLEGKNHLVRKNEQPLRKWGFFTTVFVEAWNEKEAETIAVELLRKDPKLRSQINNVESDPPIIAVDSVEQVDSFEGRNLPRTELAW